MSLDLSICVPVFNEEKNIPVLVEKITEVMLRLPGLLYEIILVDDASTDASWEAILAAARSSRCVRGLQLDRRSGESAAEEAGLKSARGRILMTIDADLENDPADIPLFLDKVREFDCVCGNRAGRRREGFVKAASSRIANAVRNCILREQLADTGCTYRAFRRQCFESVVMYNGFHRFLPTLFRMHGYSVVEIPISHARRIHGRSKYGVLNRLVKSFPDMLAVRWMRARRLEYRIRQETTTSENRDACEKAMPATQPESAEL